MNNLPKNIVNQIKMTLKAYDKCNVIYQNGQYQVNTGYCIMNEYPTDYKFIGEFKANDVFTKEEQIENYINSFCSYPPEYKGMRDYKMLKQMEQDKAFDWENKTMTKWVGKINNEGNFELTEKITTSI